MVKTVNDYIKEYFDKHPNKDIEHGDVVDYVFEHIPKARDPWRAIRKLYQEGWLIKVRKGVYKRVPGYKGQHILTPFPPDVKEAIFKRDDYRCVVCGNGKHNGYEICADHITPQYKGGSNTLENGQTLCSEHNLMKKRYCTTDFLRKYCNTMIGRAREYNDEKVESLFRDILNVIEKHESD